MSVPLVRGNVYFCDLGYGRKPWLVVSNNARNQALKSALVARITTTPKPSMDSIVTLVHGEPVKGSVLCDDIETLYTDDDLKHAGALSAHTMLEVGRALRVAFALR